MLAGPDSMYQRLVKNCFTNEADGNATWGDIKASTWSEFLELYAPQNATRAAKLTGWIAHYGLIIRFRQQQPDGKLRCCSRIHFCIQFVVRTLFLYWKCVLKWGVCVLASNDKQAHFAILNS